MADKYPVKKYPIVGACGLSCGLCPRYHIAGTSKCPGCCGADFERKHPSCGFITCCVKQRNLEACALCADWEKCERVARNLKAAADSFMSYHPLAANFASIRKNGIEEYARLESEKLAFLNRLLANYDDRRSKGFYCLACQLLSLDRLKKALAKTEAAIGHAVDIREKAQIVRAAITALASELKTDLKLRK